MDQVMRNGAVVCACLLTLLVLVGAILSSTFGLSARVMTLFGGVRRGNGNERPVVA